MLWLHIYIIYVHIHCRCQSGAHVRFSNKILRNATDYVIILWIGSIHLVVRVLKGYLFHKITHYRGISIDMDLYMGKYSSRILCCKESTTVMKTSLDPESFELGTNPKTKIRLRKLKIASTFFLEWDSSETHANWVWIFASTWKRNVALTTFEFHDSLLA